MKNYKIITTPTTTRYILESATSGATSSGSVASTEQPVGNIITREGDKNKNKVPQKPRQGPLRPQTGGGKHKDKKRAEKQGDVKHKKPFMEDHEVSMASNELKSIHANAKKLLALVQQYGEQGDIEAWQQSKITKAADYLNSVLQSIGGEQNALDELKGDPNKPDPKKISHFQNLLKTQKDRFAQQGFARAADDTDKLQKKYREPISELDKPSGTLYIILLRDRSESVRVIGDFGTFPAEVQARASKVGLKDKEGRKERPLKVNFLMTSASQALAELDKALADVDFIGGEKAEFVFKNSAFETDIEDEVKELADLIQSGADERFKNYEEPEVGNEPDPKPKGVDHFVVGPDGKRRRVPIPGKPSRQLGGHAVQQPKTYTYKLQRTDLAPKLRDMGFKFDGNNIILSKQQRDQLLAKMGDKQFGMIFGQGDRFAEAGNERNKRNPTRDFLRRYPVPQDQMVKPVKKPEKKKPEQGVAEGTGKNVVKSVKVGNFRHDLVDTGMGWQVRIYNGDELYDTGMSKNSEQKGLAALEDAVAYTEKQTRTKREGVAEEKQKGVDGKACWKGYKRMGTKKKGGRTVDNCVPVGEDAYMESLWSQLEEYKFTSLPYKGQKKEKQAPFALGSKHIGKAGGSSKSKGALSGMKASTSKDSNKPVVSTEAAPPGDKYERMVKHIKKGYAKDGKITDKERSIAYATAWKAKNKAKK